MSSYDCEQKRKITFTLIYHENLGTPCGSLNKNDSHRFICLNVQGEVFERTRRHDLVGEMHH